ncbi:hypothetical protein [Heyndrickxia acidicola]|uniref:Uncharacterized protein n=1 Tax=Heyndrickxia acidicola TaxID=209389 RepID=A0ABU6MFD3_9BACI|nr:hypothetical protein [Heyndrickxia acidicola]MED1201750.1 hypothetical protein [Heyndrickxia acidicola]
MKQKNQPNYRKEEKNEAKTGKSQNTKEMADGPVPQPKDYEEIEY